MTLIDNNQANEIKVTPKDIRPNETIGTEVTSQNVDKVDRIQVTPKDVDLAGRTPITPRFFYIPIIQKSRNYWLQDHLNCPLQTGLTLFG